MSTKMHTWGTIVLAPGQVQTWWFTWTYIRSHRWARFDACPDSDQSKIQILTQWAEKDIHGTVLRLMTFKNNGSTWVSFRPKCLSVY